MYSKIKYYFLLLLLLISTLNVIYGNSYFDRFLKVIFIIILQQKKLFLLLILNLPYYSIKDISGLFLFKLNVSEFKKKCFIKLFLEKEINFVDSVVYMDNEQKNYFEKKRFYD